MRSTTIIKVAFYSVLTTLSMLGLTICFELIRKPDTALNIAGLFLLIQMVVIDFFIIKLFNKFLNEINKITNEKSN